jgi:hypothetical protein
MTVRVYHDCRAQVYSPSSPKPASWTVFPLLFRCFSWGFNPLQCYRYFFTSSRVTFISLRPLSPQAAWTSLSLWPSACSYLRPPSSPRPPGHRHRLLAPLMLALSPPGWRWAWACLATDHCPSWPRRTTAMGYAGSTTLTTPTEVGVFFFVVSQNLCGCMCTQINNYLYRRAFPRRCSAWCVCATGNPIHRPPQEPDATQPASHRLRMAWACCDW